MKKVGFILCLALLSIKLSASVHIPNVYIQIKNPSKLKIDSILIVSDSTNNQAPETFYRTTNSETTEDVKVLIYGTRFQFRVFYSDRKQLISEPIDIEPDDDKIILEIQQDKLILSKSNYYYHLFTIKLIYLIFLLLIIIKGILPALFLKPTQLLKFILIMFLLNSLLIFMCNVLIKYVDIFYLTILLCFGLNIFIDIKIMKHLLKKEKTTQEIKIASIVSNLIFYIVGLLIIGIFVLIN